MVRIELRSGIERVERNDGAQALRRTLQSRPPNPREFAPTAALSNSASKSPRSLPGLRGRGQGFSCHVPPDGIVLSAPSEGFRSLMLQSDVQPGSIPRAVLLHRTLKAHAEMWPGREAPVADLTLRLVGPREPGGTHRR